VESGKDAGYRRLAAWVCSLVEGKGIRCDIENATQRVRVSRRQTKPCWLKWLLEPCLVHQPHGLRHRQGSDASLFSSFGPLRTTTELTAACQHRHLPRPIQLAPRLNSQPPEYIGRHIVGPHLPSIPRLTPHTHIHTSDHHGRRHTADRSASTAPPRARQHNARRHCTHSRRREDGRRRPLVHRRCAQSRTRILLQLPQAALCTRLATARPSRRFRRGEHRRNNRQYVHVP
jgi:hypothetical protein